MSNSNQYKLSKSYQDALIILTGIFWIAITYIIWGFYIEDHTGLPINIQSGLLTEGIIIENFYIYCQIFTSYIFAFLFKMNRSLPWVGGTFVWLMFLSYCIISASILFFLKNCRKDFNSPRSIFIVSSVVYVFLFLDSFVFFSGVRVSYIATSAILFGIIFLDRDTKSIRITFLNLILLTSFFFAFNIRPESGLGAVFFILSFILLSGLFKSKFIYSLILPAMIIVSSIIYLVIESEKIPFLKNTEPYLYYISDATFNPNFYTNASKTDSIKYLALEKYFFNDAEIITEQFIESMGSMKADLSFRKSNNFFHIFRVTADVLTPCINSNISHTILYLFSVFLFISTVGEKRRILFFTINQLIVVFILLMLAYFIKMENRIYLSIIIIAIFLNFTYILRIGSLYVYLKYKRKFRFYLGLSSILITIIFAVEFIPKSLKHRENGIDNERVLTKISKLCNDKILLLDVTSPIFTFSSPISLVQLPGVKKVLFYDNGQLAFLPKYKKYLDETCKCNSSKANEFFNFLISNKQNIVFISNDERLNFISGYVKIIHNIDLRYDKRGFIYGNKESLYRRNKISIYTIQ